MQLERTLRVQTGAGRRGRRPPTRSPRSTIRWGRSRRSRAPGKVTVSTRSGDRTSPRCAGPLPRAQPDQGDARVRGDPGRDPQPRAAQKDINMFGVHYLQQISDSDAVRPASTSSPASGPRSRRPRHPTSRRRSCGWRPSRTAPPSSPRARPSPIAGPPVIKDHRHHPVLASAHPVQRAPSHDAQHRLPGAEAVAEDQLPPAVRRGHRTRHHPGDGEEPQPRAAPRRSSARTSCAPSCSG